MYYIRNSFGRNTKKMRKEERQNKIADKLLKCITVDNPVRENSSDDGIEICYQDDTTSWYSNSCLLRDRTMKC